MPGIPERGLLENVYWSWPGLLLLLLFGQPG